MKKLIATIAVLGMATTAHAAITFTTVPHTSGLAANDILITNFDDQIRAGYTFTGETLDVDDTSIAAQRPFAGSGNYAFVRKDARSSLDTPGINNISFDVGTLGTAGVLVFIGDDASRNVVLGASLWNQATLDAGTDGGLGTERRFYFDFGDLNIVRIEFASTQSSFEFDNVATQSTGAVPEPAAWAMLIIGFGAVGASLRRRKEILAVS